MRLFVGNLPMDVDEAELRICFEQYGPCRRVTILRDAMRNSRQCGFVDMHDRDGLLAIQELNQQRWGERKIQVAEARPQVPRKQTA